MAEINTWPGWEYVRQLGAGSFGKVYEIQKIENGKAYKSALKVITIPQNKADIQNAFNEGMSENAVIQYFKSFVDDFTNELALMADLRGYTNIVSYEDHMILKREDSIGWDILIKMELLTPLFQWTAEHPMNEADVIKLGCDMCRALELCHKNKIIHRDIKPQNIFVNKNGDFKLGDFGIARVVEKTSSLMSQKGTYTYMAPEVFKGNKYDTTVDIYSLGIVLYRFLNYNRTPFLPIGDINYHDQQRAQECRMQGKAIPAPALGSNRLKQVVLKTLEYNPRKRIQSAEELRHTLEQCMTAASSKNLTVPVEELAPTIPVVPAEEIGPTISVVSNIEMEPGIPKKYRKPASVTSRKTKGTSIEKRYFAKIIVLLVVGVVASILLFAGITKKPEETVTEPEYTRELEETVPESPESEDKLPTPEPETTEPKEPESKTPEPENQRPTPELEVPELEMSDDLLDFTFKLDGVVYQLPFAYTELVKNGWELCGAEEDFIVNANSYRYLLMTKKGNDIWVDIINLSEDNKELKDCEIGAIYVAGENLLSPELFEIAKGIGVLSTIDEVTAAFGKPYERRIINGDTYLWYVKGYNEVYSEYDAVRFTFYEEDNVEYNNFSVTLRNYE